MSKVYSVLERKKSVMEKKEVGQDDREGQKVGLQFQMGRSGKASLGRRRVSKDLKEEGSREVFWRGKAVAKPWEPKQC